MSKARMQGHEHSYLDLSVHKELRLHVLSHEAVVVFNSAIDNIIWANASGAQLFGGRGVVDLLAMEISKSQVIVSQLKKAIEQMGDEKKQVREFSISQGLRSRLISFEIKRIKLANKDHGYKVTHSSNHKNTKTENLHAQDAVNTLSGFADAAAILDDYGLPLSVSEGFHKLGPSEDILQALIGELKKEKDRLIKRSQISLSGSSIAIGLARISNKPGRNLVVLADTSVQADDIELTQKQQNENEAIERALLSDGVETDQAEIETAKSDFEAGYLDAGTALSEDSTSHKPYYEKHDGTVRFAWVIDKNRVFQSVSPELAETVGENAAAIIGREWRDVANVFGFDTNKEIETLLTKHDTWSGKTVLWPVEGTDTVLPIDLAALPAFNSERNFEGFRGFGIIRSADAILDPDETGLALTSPTTEALLNESFETPSITTDEEFGSQQEQDADPFIQDEVEIEQPSLTDEENTAFRKIGDTLRSDEIEGEASQFSAPETETNPELERQPELAPQPEPEFKQEYKQKYNQAQEFKISEPEFASPEIETDEIIEEPFISENPTEETYVEETHIEQNVVEQAFVEEVPIDETSIEEPSDFEAQQIPTFSPIGLDVSIMENLPVAIVIYNSEEILFTNQTFLQTSGYRTTVELEEAGGIEAILTPASNDNNTETDGTKHCLKTKSGEIKPINPVLHTVPWSGEKALLISFNTNEITPKAEPPALEMSSISEIQNILDITSDGILVLEPNGRIVSINSSAEALFNISFDQAKNQDITTLFATESKHSIRHYIESHASPSLDKMFNDGQEVIAAEANGGMIPVFITISKMQSSGKLCAVIRDMTNWKKAEEELIQSRHEAESVSGHKTDFLANISHEIRTPLNSIIGFSDIMIEERFGPIKNDRYREYLRDINRSGNHVLELINDLLDLSKIEAGKLELEFEAVELNQVVSETVALLQPQANDNRIIIRTSLSRAVPKVVADARSIRQVILNLVSNAIKFSPTNSQVIVSTVYESNGEVALRIRDTGNGMSEIEIEEAMQPFQQIQRTSTKQNDGTGLGLPLTKALVEANRALFELESEPGQGTIAHVQFPTQRVLAD